MVALREFYLNKGYLVNFAAGAALVATSYSFSTLPVALRLIQFGIGTRCLGKALRSLDPVINLAAVRDHANPQAVQLTQKIIRTSKNMLYCISDSFIAAGILSYILRPSQTFK